MADEPTETPAQSIESIRRAVIAVEEAQAILHRRLMRGFRLHGHLFDMSSDQIEALAGGGTPKLPPPGGGGN